MRRGSNPNWLVNPDNGDLIGIDLSADFCAEHEWGIKDLNSMLGVKDDPSVIGIERRRITPDPKVIFWNEDKDEASLVIEHRYGEGRSVKDCSELNFRENYGKGKKKIEENLSTAWSNDDLGIRVCGEKSIKKLKKIHEAILAGDAAIWLGGGGAFKNAGLCVGIISNIPAENLKIMADADSDRQNLLLASEKTEILKKLEKFNAEHYDKGSYSARCGYYACSPAWNKDRDSKHNVVYWLNPMQQDKNNFGWYTVEQLEEWMEGKGPIPKK
jgi:hypothetical protein